MTREMNSSKDPDRKKDEKPIRVAAALTYRSGHGLPRVTATGRGALAEQILALAHANGVKVREDKDLAELLNSVDIDSEIPTEALLAVAEIIAYLYKANGKLKKDTAS
jgi:flagellar biosynthesis protein